MASVFPVGNALSFALDCLFPRLCVGCGRPGAFLCAACERTLIRIVPPLCPVCGRPQSSDILCPSCAAHPPAIAAIRSVYRLEGAARQAIHELKYNNLRALAPMLAGYLRDCLTSSGFEPEVVVPVPLHIARERHRGYNQSRLLAARLSECTGVQLNDRTLMRVKNTGTQVGSRTARVRALNVTDAFACRDSSVAGRNVLLVDDVCTTGATLDACAHALQQAGATRVWGLTVAREI